MLLRQIPIRHSKRHLPPTPRDPQAVNVTFEAVLGTSRVQLRVVQKGWSVVPGP